MASSSEARGLRLTLRTLLAWLDDTLPPTDVRRIGQQVSESPFAKELVNRINRVTRRRRLTVPTESGPEGMSATTVASYLDNELTGEQVAEFEKRCLTSDVQLAEAASCHQILSMISQKAKVPAAARHRMYRLVRGRESLPHRVSPLETAPEPVSAALPAWPEEEAGGPSILSRYALPGLVAALVLLMAVSAWMLAPRRDAQVNIVSRIDKPLPPAPRPAPPVPAPPEALPKPEAPAEDAPVEAVAAGPAEAEATAPAQPRNAVTSLEGVAARWSTEGNGSWTRLSVEDALGPDTRLVTLAPFRTGLKLGNQQVDLVGPAEVRLQAPGKAEAARFELRRGRAVLHFAEALDPVAIIITGQPLVITPKKPGKVGVEVLDHREPGGPVPATGALRITTIGAQVALAAGGEPLNLDADAAREFVAPDGFFPSRETAPPAWLTESEPSAADQAIGKAFADYFKPERPLLRALVEAIEADEEQARELAVVGLGSLNEIELVVQTLSRPGDPRLRRAAIDVLRAYGNQGPEAAVFLHEQLVRVGKEDWAKLVETLLAGFTPEQARNEETYAQLVRLLSHEDVGVRELALAQLMTLAHRDAAGYDPDRPEGAGLRAWQELLRNHELVPRPAAGAAKSTAN